MSSERSENIHDISDILIVRKITPRDPSIILEQDIASEFDEREEWELQAKELEAIVQKQYQILKADERGKQALIAEIASIKQKQEKRAQMLKNREYALEIERERSRRIALLPPPLPKTVKALLQKDDELKTFPKPDVPMPNELKVIGIAPTLFNHEENKENVLDPAEMEAKQKLLEEWNLKAQKRFKQALRKDREKEEYENIMKEVQNAELQNRRERAKSIASDKNKVVPCPLSDKFQTAKKQTDMEDAVEKVFKRNTKEHVIEDIEGYQDYYETRYKTIDSEFEAKLIDCVPKFVKENYEYLLEDEAKFERGKHFSGSDDNANNLLNQAYIESPEQSDEGRNLDSIIGQLDKRRYELQTEYDQILKPLLVASLEMPKKELNDKAVGTVMQPVEDKAVETENSFECVITPPSSVDYGKLRFNAFNRRHMGRFLPPFTSYSAHEMHNRDVFYPLPAVPLSDGSAMTSWSSSSYCSLPSKHGFPNISGSTESLKCDICAAERENRFMKETFSSVHAENCNFKSKNFKCDLLANKSSDFPSNKVPPQIDLSGCIQQVAKKYLETKSNLSNVSANENKKKIDDSYVHSHSTAEISVPAFEKEMVSKTSDDLPLSKHQKLTIEMPMLEMKTDLSHFSNDIESLSRNYNEKNVSENVEKASTKHTISQNAVNDEFYCKNYDEIDHSKFPENQTDYSEYEVEMERLQAIQQVLARKIPHLNCNISSQPTNESYSDASLVVSSYDDFNKDSGSKPHMYHELSTIQEMDSVLTAGNSRFSQSFEKSSVIEKSSIMHKENLADSTEKLKIVSLLDPPNFEIDSLVKRISFVADNHDEVTEPSRVSKTLYSENSVIDLVSSKESSHFLPSSHASESSSDSDIKVISSSLSRSHVKYPHLRSTETLSKYFEDVSDIKQSKNFISENSAKFSKLSSICLSTERLSSSSSNPSIPPAIDKNINNNKYDLSTSHSLISGYLSNVKNPYLSNSNNFFPMSLNSDISSLSARTNSPVRSVQDIEDCRKNSSSDRIDFTGASSKLSGSFKPMTPHSDISSPKTPDSRYQYHINDSAESFKPMSPKSIISSPSLPNNEMEFGGKVVEKKEKSLNPANMRFNISSPQSFLSDKMNIEYTGTKKLGIDISLKARISNLSKQLQSKDLNNEIKSTSNYLGSSKNAPLAFQLINEKQPNKDESGKTELSQIFAANVSSLQTNSNELEESKLSQIERQSFKIGSKQHVHISSIESSNSSQVDAILNKLKYSTTESTTSCENSSIENFQRSVSRRKPTDLIKNLISLDTELPTNLKKHYGNLQPISSTSSSSENLSDMFTASKIMHQSTPIKSWEDFPQESKLISDESELTLIQVTLNPNATTQFNPSGINNMSQAAVKLNSKKESPATQTSKNENETTTIPLSNFESKTSCIQQSPVSDCNIPSSLQLSQTPSMQQSSTSDCKTPSILETSTTECKTPSILSPQSLHSANTPSMLSFLQHEISCMQESKAATSQEKKYKLPRTDYKHRTKRLWNNLEEVKKKNSAEEQKKLMLANRQKAKEYAKKVNSKKK